MNHVEERGPSGSIMSQVKLLILFTADLSGALNDRFCFDLNLVKLTLAHTSARAGRTLPHFSWSVRCSGNTPAMEHLAVSKARVQTPSACPLAGLTAWWLGESPKGSQSAGSTAGWSLACTSWPCFTKGRLS